MRLINLKHVFLLSLIFYGACEELAYGAVDQILTDNFFQNPAELSQVNKAQIIAGDLFIMPALEFTGTTRLGTGSAKSRVHNSLPYLLTAYRFTDKVVLGVNVVPTGYGHISWPMDSIVVYDSTTTKLFYYRIGTQVSYTLNDNLTFGFGFNVNYQKLAELDYVVPALGNQINKIHDVNYSADAGLYYKINSKNYFTVAYYSPLDTFGEGSSTLNQTVVNNFALNIYEASVAYIGLQHYLSDKWFLQEKIYWSGWSLEKTVDFINTTTGSFSVPANWRDAWSFQIVARYTLTDRMACLGALIYETNPVPTVTNQLGYPLAPAGAVSAGLDWKFQKDFSAQLMYGYGAFMPNAIIDNATTHGQVAVNFQSVVFQLTYRV